MSEVRKRVITRPGDLEARIARTKKESRARVIARGKVEFRLDKVIMAELLKRADEVQVPYGVYARMLMIKALKQDS